MVFKDKGELKEYNDMFSEEELEITQDIMEEFIEANKGLIRRFINKKLQDEKGSSG